MENIFFYYFSFSAPLFLLFLWEYPESLLALALLAGYVFVYRPWLDGSRLHQKGLISKKEIWKVLFMGYHIKYFKALYLQR